MNRLGHQNYKSENTETKCFNSIQKKSNFKGKELFFRIKK